MKQATFADGVGIALLSSVIVAAVFMTMSSVFIGGDLFRLLISMLSFFYMLYLFSRSGSRIGKVTTIFIWFVITFSALVFVHSIIMTIAIHLLMIWLIRSLYFYNSLFSSFIDLALTILSLMIAVWVWSFSGSLFLSFWCFFLMQALFVFIPISFSSNQKSSGLNKHDNDRFEHAYRAAELAVRNISINH